MKWNLWNRTDVSWHFSNRNLEFPWKYENKWLTCCGTFISTQSISNCLLRCAVSTVASEFCLTVIFTLADVKVIPSVTNPLKVRGLCKEITDVHLCVFLEANWMSVCSVSYVPWDKAPGAGSNVRNVASSCIPYTPGGSPAPSPPLLPSWMFWTYHLPHWNLTWASTTVGSQVTHILLLQR